MLARDAAAHRAMLIVGRFLTGRRARQRTACLGISGLALLSSANIASTDRPVGLIASAAYMSCLLKHRSRVDRVARADAGGCNQLQLSLSEPSVLNLLAARVLHVRLLRP